MRRLIQFGTFLFLLVMFLAPICEFFDSWDPPGLSDDTEFAVFALAFALCLVLVVCMLLKGRALLIRLLLGPKLTNPPDQTWLGSTFVRGIFIPPPLISLRI